MLQFQGGPLVLNSDGPIGPFLNHTFKLENLKSNFEKFQTLIESYLNNINAKILWQSCKLDLF